MPPKKRGTAARNAGAGESVLLFAVAFLLSGCAGLIHEVVWVRLLAHVFGVTAFATATVLAAYMGGLALGAFLMGGRAARLRDPARLYAWIEIGIGLFALAIPSLLDAIEPLYGWLWRRFHLSFVSFSLLRLVVAGTVLLVPTWMMGATLPLLVQHFARRGTRRAAPEWLYTINLAGAVAGVAAAGFWLLPALGVRGTIFTGAALNIGVGLAVLFFAARPSAATRPSAPAHPAAPTPHGEPSPVAAPPLDRILLGAAFLSGLGCLASQVAWTRLIALLIGSTTYAFSTVLLVFLVALAAGAAWISRRPGDPASARRRLAVLNVLAAVALVAATVLVNRWPTWYWWMYGLWQPAGLGGGIVLNAVAISVLLLPSALLAGMIFPLTLAATRVRESHGTAAGVGRLYAVNTLGAIGGAIMAGFLLIPWIGSQGTMRAIAAVTALFAGVCAATVRDRRLAGWVVAGIAVTAAGVVVSPAWDVRLLNSSIYQPRAGVDPRTRNLKDEVIFHKEGATASVAVTLRPPNTRSLKINGRINASSEPRDLATNILLSQLPILMAPRADNILVVGLGSGVTSGAALRSPARRVTTAELEPAVVEASRLFDDVSHAPLTDPRLVLVADDARHLLAASPDRYDIIISEPSQLWVAGVAPLFTQDFFMLATRRLEPDGLFAQWVQTYQISHTTFQSILATFQSVFPEVLIFRSIGTDLILIGSQRPLRIDLAELERRWLDPAVRAELGRVGFPGPESLLAHFLAGPDQVRSMVAGAVLNTDDNMLVEFRAPADLLLPADEAQDEIFRKIAITPVEAALSDPALLMRRPESLRALVEALTVRKWPAEKYQRILAGM